MASLKNAIIYVRCKYFIAKSKEKVGDIDEHKGFRADNF